MRKKVFAFKKISKSAEEFCNFSELLQKITKVLLVESRPEKRPLVGGAGWIADETVS
jgi:hypothetical protein